MHYIPFYYSFHVNLIRCVKLIYYIMEYSDRKPMYRQIWISSAVFLNMIGEGIMYGYPTSILPALRDPDSSIKVDFNSASWIASSIGLATLPGYLLSPIFMELYGRRISNILAGIPAVLGWILIYFSQNVTNIIIGRIFGGLSAGSTIILGGIAIGEYASPEYRGVLLNLKSTSICIGNLIVHLLGTYFHWRSVALMAFVPHFLAVIIIWTWPESPMFLVSRKKFSETERVLFYLRGKTPKSIKELEDLIASQSDKVKSERISIVRKTVFAFKSLAKMELYKPLLVIIAGTTIMEFGGRHIFPAFILDIVGGILGDTANLHSYIFALDIIISVSAIMSSILVKFFTRRSLFLISGFIGVFILISISILCYLITIKVLSSTYSSIAMILLVIYLVLINIGPIPIAICFLGELLPLSLKGIGTAFSGVILSSILQISLQVAPYLLAYTRVYGTFAMISLILFVSFSVLYFIMPESKDKSLLEIENFFKYGDYESKESYRDIEMRETRKLVKGSSLIES